MFNFKNLKEKTFNKNFDKSKRYTAFTLAEVLIVLGIIGIIAEITIPTLVNNVKNAQASAGVKKAISTLANAINLSNMNNGTNFSCSYISRSDRSIDFSLTQYSGCQDLWNSLKSNLRVMKSCDYNTSANYFGNCLPPNGIDDSNVDPTNCLGLVKSYQKIGDSALLMDGTYVYMYALPTSEGYPFFSYDINGFKGPNKYGDDVFNFIIVDYNKIVPDRCYAGGYDAQAYIIGDK